MDRTELLDPWAVDTGDSPARPAGLRDLLLAVAVVVVGAGGTALDVLPGGAARAVVLVASAAVWTAVLDRRRRSASAPEGRVPPEIAALVAAIVAALVAAIVAAGWAAAAVTVAAVALAHGSLHAWRPWSPSAPPGRTESAALPLALVVIASLVWWRSEMHAASAALLAAAVLLLGLVGRVGRIRDADALAVRGLSRLGAAAASLVVAVVAVPFLYLPAALWTTVRRARRTPGWRPVEVHPEDVRRDAHRPFASVPPATRMRRNVVGLAGLLVVALLVGPRVARSDDVDGPAGGGDGSTMFARARDVPLSALPAYRDVPFADELKREQDRFTNSHFRFDPHTWLAYTDFSGRYTNVVDGARRTPPPPPCPGCAQRSVWLVGGSAAFGLGQRDDHTLAAALVRGAAEAGVALEVRNLGVPSWTAWQELRAVRARLEAGEPPPDALLFYDGFNDVLGAVVESTTGRFDPHRPNLLLIWEALEAEERGYSLDDDVARTIADTAADRYLTVVDEGDALGARFGVATAWVLQPDAFAATQQLDAVRSVLSPPLVRNIEPLRRTLDRFEQRIDGSVTNLRHVVDDRVEPFYADLVHMNEAGAEIVAAALLPTLLELLLGASSVDASGG